MKRAIFGAGGFGRELYHHMKSVSCAEITLFCDDAYAKGDVKPISRFDPAVYEMIVAVGDPIKREVIVKSLPKETQYFSFIDPSALILDSSIVIGRGSTICAGCILTTNITVGEHCHFNLHTTVGHDTNIGNYFTSAPGVNISGNCNFGERVHIGTNASIREKINIINDVTIGLNSGVVSDIVESGTYVGTPARKIK